MGNKKNIVLLVLAILAFINGATTQYLEPGVVFPKTDMWFMFAGIFFIYMWYYIDSEQVKYKRGALLNIAIVALGAVALPYYFFRSRGFKKGLIHTVIFFLLVALWVVLQTGGAYAVYYGIQS